MLGGITVLTGVYPTSAFVLFCLMSYASAALFQSIQTQVEQIHHYQNRADRLALIQRRHTFSCEVVDCINDCFGCNLLLSVSFLLVSIINLSFYMFGDDGISTSDVSFAVVNVIHLVAISLAADSINKHVVFFLNIKYYGTSIH